MKKLKGLVVAKTVVCLILISSGQLFAQADKNLVDLADEMYEFGDYEDALGIYLQAIEVNPNNVRAYLQSGHCYLKTTSRKKNAVDYYKKAYDLDPEVSNKIFFYIGEGYRFGYEFDQAINYYKQFLEELKINRRANLGEDVDALEKKTERRIFECENAKIFTQNPKDITIVNLGIKVNSEYEDYAPVISRDQQTLIFTSKRAGSTGGFKDIDNKFFEDIWMSVLENDEWSAPINMGEKINTLEHESNLGLSPDGNTLYLYKDENGGDIYYSVKDPKKGWSKSKALGDINTDSRETSVFVTDDGETMFFTSNRPGGAGEGDIYRAKSDGKGGWEDITRLSDVINTSEDEEGPIFDSETGTLYFSSKGHKGMGGFDLYAAKYDEASDTWEEPTNLGYPINSTDDDLYFTLAADGKTAYFSSFKEDSEGGNDIYMMFPLDLNDLDSIPDEPKEPVVSIDTVNREAETAARDTKDEPEEPVVNEEEQLPVSFGLQVIDGRTNEGIEANLKIYELESDEELVNTTITDGLYTREFEYEQETRLIVTVEAEGYLFQTIQLDVPAMNSRDQPLTRKLSMRPAEKFVINKLRNVYFDFDQHTLRSQSSHELDLLEKHLKDHPAVKIQIAGHTDSVGSDEYNQSLSERRSKAVKSYLLQKGIGDERVIARGYGKSKPLASNDDEAEGRELNRRTEFIIVAD